MFSNNADLIATALRGPQGPSDSGYYTGTIIAWDDTNGLNTVMVNEVPLSNLKVVRSGAGLTYRQGDVVMIARKQSQYFVLGKVDAPGSARSDMIASNRVPNQVIEPPAQAFGDLPGSPGPTVTVYIGSSRRCLVIHSCEVYCSGLIVVDRQSELYQAVQVTNASNLAVETAVTDAFFKGIAGSSASVAATTFVTATDGLNQGFNTFTCKYKVVTDADQGVTVANRVLSVIPY